MLTDILYSPSNSAIFGFTFWTWVSFQIYLKLTSYTLIYAVKSYAELAFLEFSMGLSGSHLNIFDVSSWSTTTVEKSFGGQSQHTSPSSSLKGHWNTWRKPTTFGRKLTKYFHISAMSLMWRSTAIVRLLYTGDFSCNFACDFLFWRMWTSRCVSDICIGISPQRYSLLIHYFPSVKTPSALVSPAANYLLPSILTMYSNNTE